MSISIYYDIVVTYHTSHTRRLTRTVIVTFAKLDSTLSMDHSVAANTDS